MVATLRRPAHGQNSACQPNVSVSQPATQDGTGGGRQKPAVLRQCIRSSFGELGALFLMRAGTSSAEGGCSDLDPFRDSGCGAKLICNRLARLAKTVHFLAPLIAAVRCHSPNSRTRQVHLQLERASPAAQPTSSRHKRSRSSSIGSMKLTERDTRADVRSKALRRARRESTPSTSCRAVGIKTRQSLLAQCVLPVLGCCFLPVCSV